MASLLILYLVAGVVLIAPGLPGAWLLARGAGLSAVHIILGFVAAVLSWPVALWRRLS